MKIDEIYQNTNIIHGKNESIVKEKAQEEQNSKSDQAKKEDKQSGTEVAFSKTSVEFSKATTIMETEPVERAERINEIRDRINNGTYEINATKVADKIIKNTLSTMLDG